MIKVRGILLTAAAGLALFVFMLCLNTFSATASLAASSTAPQNVKAKITSTTKPVVNVSWKAVSGASKYNVYVTLNGSKKLLAGSTAKTSFTLDCTKAQYKNYTELDFKVAAVDKRGAVKTQSKAAGVTVIPKANYGINDFYYIYRPIIYAVQNQREYFIYNAKAKQVMNKCKSIAKKIQGSNRTQGEKALALHDYIINNCKYDYDNYLKGNYVPDSFTPYGVLVKGVAVCQGYADTYTIISELMGMKSYVATGKTNTGVNHAWNIARIDGKYYQLDVTFDDPVDTYGGKNYLVYDYFMITDSEMWSSRTQKVDDRTKRKLPSCASARFKEFRSAMNDAVYSNGGSGVRDGSEVIYVNSRYNGYLCTISVNDSKTKAISPNTMNSLVSMASMHAKSKKVTFYTGSDTNMYQYDRSTKKRTVLGTNVRNYRVCNQDVIYNSMVPAAKPGLYRVVKGSGAQKCIYSGIVESMGLYTADINYIEFIALDDAGIRNTYIIKHDGTGLKKVA